MKTAERFGIVLFLAVSICTIILVQKRQAFRLQTAVLLLTVMWQQASAPVDQVDTEPAAVIQLPSEHMRTLIMTKPYVTTLLLTVVQPN